MSEKEIERSGNKAGQSEELNIALDGTVMKVIRFGQGKKNLVILSGVSLCGIGGLGDGVAQAYGIFAEEYTVYLLDRKMVLPQGYTTDEMAEDVYRVLTGLGVKEAAVYGVSHGGMMAQCLTIRHPAFVSKLVLCATLPRAGEMLKEVCDNWLTLAGQEDVIGLNRYFFGKVYSEAFLNSVREFLPTLEKVGTAEDCHRFCVLAKACKDFDKWDELDGIQCPVLVLGDENDRVLGVEGSYQLAERLGCESYIYNAYSHAVFDEAPDIKERVKAFLEKE